MILGSNNYTIAVLSNMMVGFVERILRFVPGSLGQFVKQIFGITIHAVVYY